MDDLKQVMKKNYLTYASYVILDRAIPSIDDGLKPVQRRILHTLFGIHDGKLHKVANVAGQTMAYHPHGDAPINDALVNLAMKGYLLDTQGNFGNLVTGDPAAAPRYIETRLSSLATETMFNKDLTEFLPSYDGRSDEPVCLPAKIPVLLMQGADGIAVGMSTRVLPHNFKELLEAQIAILQNKPFKILPDFPTGGVVDASLYDKGRGKVQLRAKIEIKDKKTVVIREICYATTTESLIRSIDEAAKRGKVRIDAINDYTASEPEIEITLPRGHYAEDLVEALYAYTDAQVSLNSQIVVIKDGLPIETDVDSVLRHNTEKLQSYLQQELELQRDRLLEKIFHKTLEQIFIENRLYKKIETVSDYEKIHSTVAKSLQPYHKKLSRIPSYDDRERLLQIPIRRISRFDLDKSQDQIQELIDALADVEKSLKKIKAFTISYLKKLVKKFAPLHPRRTAIQEIEQVDLRALEEREIKIGVDAKSGFIGTSVKSDLSISCSNFDKLLLLFTDGTYRVINIPEKQYIHDDGRKLLYAAVADKETVLNIVYRQKETKVAHVKRFVVSQFILDKEYSFMDPDCILDYFTTDAEKTLIAQLVPKPKQKINTVTFSFLDYAVKNPKAKGVRVSARQVKKIKESKRAVKK